MLLASEDIKQKQNERTNERHIVPNMLLASEDIKQKQNERQRPFPPSVPAEAGCFLTVAAVRHNLFV